MGRQLELLHIKKEKSPPIQQTSTTTDKQDSNFVIEFRIMSIIWFDIKLYCMAPWLNIADVGYAVLHVKHITREKTNMAFKMKLTMMQIAGA